MLAMTCENLGFWSGHTQIRMLSYIVYSEYWNLACSKFRYEIFL